MTACVYSQGELLLTFVPVRREKKREEREQGQTKSFSLVCMNHYARHTHKGCHISSAVFTVTFGKASYKVVHPQDQNKVTLSVRTYN